MELTKDYKLICSKKSSTYSELRLYGKYNSQDKTKNQTIISLQLRLYGNGGSGSFSSGTAKIQSSSTSLGETSYSNGKETILKTYTYTVTHSTTGEYKNKTVTGSISSTASVSATCSGTISVPTILRNATVTSASDFTDEENPTLSFSNPASFSIHPYLKFYDDNNTAIYSLERNISATSPYVWNITDEEREILRAATNKQKNYRVEIGVKTFSGTSLIGTSYKTQYMYYVNATSSQEASFLETNQKVIDILKSDNCETVIQNVSKIKIASTPELKKSATIKNIQFIHEDSIVNKTVPPYENIFDVKSDSFKVKITDSRNFEQEYSYKKNIIEYLPVDIMSFSFKREVQTSAKIILNATLRYNQTNFGSIANVPSITWKMGETGELKTLTSSNYTIDVAKKEITIKNLSLGEILDYRKKEKFFLYISDLLTEDTENVDVVKGLTTLDMGEHDVNVNGTITLHDDEGNNKIDIRDYLFEYEVIGTYEGE